jgi:hypothetical protein
MLERVKQIVTLTRISLWNGNPFVGRMVLLERVRQIITLSRISLWNGNLFVGRLVVPEPISGSTINSETKPGGSVARQPIHSQEKFKFLSKSYAKSYE